MASEPAAEWVTGQARCLKLVASSPSMITRLLKLFISILVFIVDTLHGHAQLLGGRRRPGRLVVLYYHGVSRAQRERFGQQMDTLSRRAKPVFADTDEILDDGIHYVAVTFDDGFVSFLENVFPELNKRQIPSTVFVPSAFLGQTAGWIEDGQENSDGKKVLSGPELKRLAVNRMVSVGSHGRTHRNLLKLNNEEAFLEISRSKQELEAVLGHAVKELSFPYGGYDGKLVEMAKSVGYSRVYTILPKPIFSFSDRYICGRISVEPTDWRLEFFLKQAGAYCWLPAAFFLKRQILGIFNSRLKNKVFHDYFYA